MNALEIERFCDYLRSELKRMDEMSPEEAKRYAKDFLIEIGLIDSDGNYAYPYSMMMSEAHETRRTIEMTDERQGQLLCDYLRNELEERENMTPEERRRTAEKALIEIGFLDSDGNYAYPYSLT